MELHILYLNDVHGYLTPHNELFYDQSGERIETVGGYSRIATLVHRIRRRHPSALLFDGGDTFHGTYPMVESKGEAIIPVLNHLSFDAMVGHWDFAYGPKQLKHILSKLNHPMLGINVFHEDGSLFFDPHVMLMVDDLRVGVIGICSAIIGESMPAEFSEGLTITNGIDELPAHIAQLKSDGADLIIVLSHNGFPQDMHMLDTVSGIDICLSAHTHNRLYEPVRVGESILIQCGCHGSFLGHLALQMDGKRITGHEYQLMKVDNHIQPDSDMERIIETVQKPYPSLEKNIVGRTTSTLHRYDTLNSSMDSLLLHALMHVSGTTVAFSNGWRYGAPIGPSDITEDDLHNIIPVNPPVSTVEMTGREIKTMLEKNLERTFSSEPMKQMGGYAKRCAGLRIHLRIEHPAGHRIQEIYRGDAHLHPDETVKVSFVTTQGVPPNMGTNRQDLDITAVDAMKQFLRDHPEFDAGKEPVFVLA